MGRGRAKAKQVKVARQLKYSGGGTDLDRLRAELGVDSDQHGASGDSAYADLGDRYSGTTTTLITHRMRTTRTRTGTTRITASTAPRVSSGSPARRPEPDSTLGTRDAASCSGQSA